MREEKHTSSAAVFTRLSLKSPASSGRYTKGAATVTSQVSPAARRRKSRTQAAFAALDPFNFQLAAAYLVRAMFICLVFTHLRPHFNGKPGYRNTRVFRESAARWRLWAPFPAFNLGRLSYSARTLSLPSFKRAFMERRTRPFSSASITFTRTTWPSLR